MTPPPATLLTLKNLYRLLTQADYPFPSDIPLSRSARRGLTIYAFWRDILAPGLPNTPQGEKLWTVGDTRSRYLSDLFNRSQPANFYPEYFKQAAHAVTPDFLLLLVQRLDNFLKGAGYTHKALCQRMSGFLALVSQEDTEVTPAVHSYLGELMWQTANYDTDEERSRFFCSYVLSVTALHAFFGLRMNNGPMGRMRREAAYTPEALFTALRAGRQASPHPWPDILTGTACELCREPLDEALFFGREEALENLKQQILRGGKILLSGLGGIGKTELLRQALSSLLREGLFTRVAFVQYRGSLMDSFLATFQDLHGNTPLTRFSECLDRLSQGEGHPLLLIDNIDLPPGEDPDLAMLKDLPYAVVATSRLMDLNGFRTIRLEEPGRDAAQAIFAAHYGKPLDEDELRLLDHLLEEHLQYHPLMCQMLGSMARSRHLGIRALYEALGTHGLKGSYMRQAQSVSVEDTLMQLFQAAPLKKELRRLLRLFALLPQRNYHFSRLLELLRDITEDRGALADMLENLRYLGWLQNRDDGFSMHPLIAEALLQKPVQMAEFPRFFGLLSEKTQTDKYREWSYIDIANSALLKSEARGNSGYWLLLNTSALLLEQNLHAAMRRLMDKARPLLLSPHQQDANLAFAWHSVNMYYLRALSPYEEVRAAIREVLRLFPGTTKPASRPVTLGHALHFAIKLSMQEEMNTLYGLITQTPWEDSLEKAQYCYVMGEYNVYATRDCREMTRWGEEGLDTLEKAGMADCLEAANLHHVTALGYSYCGNTVMARRHIERSKALLLHWYGDTDSLVFAAYDNSLGTAHDTAGDYKAAITYYQSALDRFRRILKGDSGSVEDVLNNLSNAYLHQGDLGRALHYSKEAFAMHSRLHSEHNLQTALLHNNLGAIQRDSGQYEDALSNFETARDIAKQLTGMDSLMYAEPTMNTGRTHLLKGEKEEALRHIREALPLFTKYYGEEHPRTQAAREALEKALSPDGKSS